MIQRLLPFVAILFAHAGSANAQQPGLSPSLNLGDAVVTGFSGNVASEPHRGATPSDLTFINPDGPSVRIFDIGRPGRVWDGSVFAAPKKFDVPAKDVGQVFGVALDDQTPPNIYVAATSAFGLNIVSRGRDGRPERRKKGGPGAGWMKGQFGLDLQGGPGGIFKIDGRTGVATLFANVTLDGVPNPGAALGNLAYDSAHKQLFVSDLYTGMIHRFDLDGRDLGRYDHGVTGLGAAKLAAVPFSPANRPNIASDRFDSEKPETWGFAPAARRVFGLAVHDGRLYYSVVSGPQIWSVGIEQDGNFAADPRWELDVPAQAGPLPVSDIAFSQKGAMILAQRALIAGAYDYLAFTRPGEPQVFRVWLKGPNDPPSPGRWKAVPEEYAVGFPGNYRNTNGGVALGYGYGADGMLKTDACEFSLWSTGQNLRNAPALKTRLDPGGPLPVHGIQGVPASPVRDVNTPPWLSYSIDYDDKPDDPRATGHLGSVRIYTKPCAPPAVYSGPGYAANAPYTAGSTPPTVVIVPPPCIGPNCPPPPPTPIDLGVAKTAGLTGNVDYPYSFNIAVTNLGGPLTGPQTITVTDVVPAGMTFTTVTSPNWNCLPAPVIPSGGTMTCTYTGTFPVASNQLLGSIDIIATGGDGPYQNCANLGQTDGNSSNNKACVTVQKPQVGYLIVKKAVVYVGPLLLPAATYPVNVTCGSNTTTLNLSSDGTPQTVSNLPYGTNCSVVEPTPPVPANACPPNWTGTWSITTAPSPIPPISGTTTTVTVTNTLTCAPGNQGDQFGELLVKKQVVSHLLGNAIPSANYAVNVTCGSNTTTLSLPSSGTTQAVNNIPYGTQCTVNEPSPPIPPNLCPLGTTGAWTISYSTSSIPPISGTTTTVTVTNTFDCNPDGGGTTSVTVTKQVINQTDPQISTAGITYTGNVSCVSGMSPAIVTSFSLTDGGSQTINNVTIGATCTVTENTPTVPPGSCPNAGDVLTWMTVPPAPVLVGSSPQVMTVQNILGCKPGNNGGTGGVTVTKNVTNNTSGTVTNTTYAASVTCGGNATNMTLMPNVPQTISNLAFGTSCTVQETEVLQTPPIAACTGATHAAPAWTTTYLPSNTAAASNPPAAITVQNTLDCKPTADPDYGAVSVYKTVHNGTTADVSALQFPMTITCGSISFSLSLKDGQTNTWPNVPIGLSCSVTETLPPPPTTGCPTGQTPTWLTPPVFTPPTVLAAHAGAIIGVHNTLVCKGSGDNPNGWLIVDKVVQNTTGASVAGLTFPATVTCTQGGNPSAITLWHAHSETFNNIPVGATCTVNEPTPTAPTTGCPPGQTPTWTVSYAPSASVPIVSDHPASVIVTNSLDCKGGSQIPTGQLLVKKVLQNNTAASVAGLTYPMSATCSSGGSPGSNTSLSLSDGGSQTINNLAAGLSCSVSEPTPATPTGGCSVQGQVPTWTIGVSSPVTITAGQTSTITVTNTLDCKGGGTQGGGTGGIQVTKMIEDNRTFTTSLTALNFPITATCGGTSVTGSVKQYVNTPLTGLPLGATCTVSETLPAPPTNGCASGTVPTWGPQSYIPASVTAGSGAGPLLTVKNVLNCMPPGNGGGGSDPNTGYLLVTKRVVNNTSASIAGIQFSIVATCGSIVGNLSLAHLSQGSVPAIPAGTSCVVTEPTFPPPPSGGCQTGSPQWTSVTVTQMPPGPITAGAGPTVMVENTLNCVSNVPPPSCTPPMVSGTAPGSCVCPSGMTQTGGGSCVCPQGTSYVPGAGCMPQTPPPSGRSSTSSSTPQSQCTPPMIQNAAGPGCVCPTGMTATAGGGCTATTSPTVCTPPMIQGLAANTCICPVGMTATPADGCTATTPPTVCTPPMIQNAAGPGCVCPTGMTATAGGGCTTTTPPTVCTPPMIQGVAANVCVCPQGMTATPAGGCMTTPPTQQPPPSQCRPPMVPGTAVGACVCPSGTTKKGNSCIAPDKKKDTKEKNRKEKDQKKKEPESKQPRIDLPRGIPGVGFPGLGGRGSPIGSGGAGGGSKGGAGRP